MNRGKPTGDKDAEFHRARGQSSTLASVRSSDSRILAPSFPPEISRT